MATVEEAKKQRTTALRLFTRENNGLNNVISGGYDIRIVKERFQKLQKLYSNVQEAHERYVAFILDDDEVESVDDEWIKKVEFTFQGTEKNRYSYELEQNDHDEDRELNRKITIKENEDRLQEVQRVREIETAQQLRRLEEVAFTNLCENLENLLDPNAEKKPCVAVMEELQRDFKSQYQTCKNMHTKLILLLDSAAAEREIRWVARVQSTYIDMIRRIGEYVHSQHTGRGKTDKAGSIRLERLKMPHFHGNIRDYPRFKSDFIKQVYPEITVGSAAYTLKSCLSKDPFELVKNVDDDYDDMWKRLDQRYGKASKLADVVMYDIKQLVSLKEGEERKFLEFVDTIERGYRDLARLKIEHEISNTSVVSIIEEKLPKGIKREWSRLVNKSGSPVDERNKFPALLEFLLEEKRIIEYESSDLRSSSHDERKGTLHHVKEEGLNEDKFKDHPEVKSKWKEARCFIHNTTDHGIEACNAYRTKSPGECLESVNKSRVCWSCLRFGHRYAECIYKKVCGKNGCTQFHHQSLHGAFAAGVGYHANGSVSGGCLLQLMKIETGTITSKKVNVMWDAGATLNLVTFQAAKKLGLKGSRIKLSIVKVGNKKDDINSYEYELPLVDKSGQIICFKAYGIDHISTEIKRVKLDDIIHLFPGCSMEEIQRPCGEIEVLLGLECAGYHPVRMEAVGNLLLMKNQFGSCLSGSHPLVEEVTEKVVDSAIIHHVMKIDMEDFFNREGLGVSCVPVCGGCKCGKCALGSKSYTLKEERELKMIEKGLVYKGGYWEAIYPWVRTPSDLPDNKHQILCMLKATEKRLMKNDAHREMYQKQIDDMISRNVARKLSKAELQNYKGPKYYISHHEVLNPKSASTPCRLVFNSSARFQGHQLNEYWAKGPDMINNLLAILIRFRENLVAAAGDIKKMYHAVKIGELDQHTHRFLWRDMETLREPDTYVMTSVSFGDKPAGSIASHALKKTADMGLKDFPEASARISQSIYVDDIIDSYTSREEATKITSEIDQVLRPGGFEIKKWEFSADRTGEIAKNSCTNEHDSLQNQKVLGLKWDNKNDEISFDINLNFSPNRKGRHGGPDAEKDNIIEDFPAVLTRRIALSQINRIYDPLGLLTPVTIKAKILMRKLWMGNMKQLGWDDEIPQKLTEEWGELFKELVELQAVSFKRSIQPENAIGKPVLVMFSDGSDEAYGTCAYVRWEIEGNRYVSHLLAAKCKMAPLKTMSIVRIELNGALLAKRLACFIVAESRLQFRNIYFLVDSEIVRSMIQKESYGFSTFAAVRIGEIQEGTKPGSWYWLEGKKNIADWVTRGKSPQEMHPNSLWQRGPDFLQLDESEWPIKQGIMTKELPEMCKSVFKAKMDVSDSLAERININRHSNYKRLILITSRVLSMYRAKPYPSFKNATYPVSGKSFEEAENFWIKDAQSTMNDDVKKGRYRRLCPQVRSDGVIIVGKRMEKWLEITYNQKNPILLPNEHRISKLYAEFIHSNGHLGVATTVSKIRERFWIPNIHRIARSIRYNCRDCKILDKRVEMQAMAKLPIERLKPAPAWTNTSLDIFGPFIIRGQLNKRNRGKAYGIIFNCLLTRAVYLDLADDYSTQGFLFVLRRFVCIRGYPSKLISDSGSQLVAANKEMRALFLSLNKKELQEFGAENGLSWQFTPPDSPWRNGCAEALIKSTKRAITAAIGQQVLNFSELQTILFEVGNLMNERPIGRHPTDPNDGSYICPNDLILGRATARVPSGPFNDIVNNKKRFNFAQQLANAFWKKWTRDYFPCLIVQQKWHHDKRNVRVDDVVMIQDSKLVRGRWRLGVVSKVYVSEDDKVRKVCVKYKNLDVNEELNEYHGKRYTHVDRAVQRLIVICPAEDREN